MDFEKEFPLRFWINLGRREDRRMDMEGRLEELGITAERFAAVDAAGVKSATGKRRTLERLSRDAPATMKEVRGYESAGRYSLALTQRLALREAARRGAPAVLLLEDDVVFHPNFQTLIGAVDLPEDWGIFYLGCAHAETPDWAGRRVVRVSNAVDTHAVAIRAPYFRRVMEMLDRHGKPDLGVAKASDQFLALLHKEIPTYACYPNLAWQDVSGSDLKGEKYSNYTKDGRQKNWGAAVEGLLAELVNGDDKKNCGETPQPRLGLLFLTRGDVQHPEIWRDFVAEAPERVSVFSHAKTPGKLKGGFLENSVIREHFETKWGDISLVRASRAMLLEALEDESLTHFVLLSESCLPIRPLPEILRRLELDPRPQFGFRTLKEASARHASRIGAVPGVPHDCWRFQSQWWLMDRVAATFAAGQDFTEMFAKMFVPDEAYFATVLAMQGYPLEGEVLKKDVTWTWWEKDAGSPTEWLELPTDRLRDLLHSGALFARKFSKNSDIRTRALHRGALRS
jgi:Core-2/I-Branching enzyme